MWDGRRHDCLHNSSESPFSRIYSMWIHQFIPKYMQVAGELDEE